MNREVLPLAPFRQARLEEVGVCDFDTALLDVPCRAVSRVPPDTASIIVVALPYYVGSFPHRNVSRYAMLPDYHDVAGALLAGCCRALERRFPGGRFVPFADASPLSEVEAGVRAGIGVRGRNGQLINKRYGSYIFIGEIFSTVPFLASSPAAGACLGCGACIRACPGGALGADGFHRGRCLSHITQKKRLEPGEAARVASGGFAWGCDICTDVCPMNRGAAYSPIAPFYRNILAVATHNNLDRCFGGRAWSYKSRALMERNITLITGD